MNQFQLLDHPVKMRVTLKMFFGDPVITKCRIDKIHLLKHIYICGKQLSFFNIVRCVDDIQRSSFDILFYIINALLKDILKKFLMVYYNNGNL